MGKPCPICMQKNPWKNACFEIGVVKNHCQNGTSDDCCGSPNTPNAIAAGCKMNPQTGEHDFHTPPELIRFEGKKIVNGDVRGERCGTVVPGTVRAGDPVPRKGVASATFTLAAGHLTERISRYKPKKVFEIGLISDGERICQYNNNTLDIERGSEVTVPLVNRKVTFIVIDKDGKNKKERTIQLDDGPDVQ